MNQKGTQLQMFAPAKQIVETHDLGDMGIGTKQSTASKEAALSSKYDRVVNREGEYNGPRTFANGGIKKPITITHAERPTVTDGHHRLAWAYKTNPNTEVPLTHREW